MTLMTSGVIQRQLWRPFNKTSSKIVLKGGLGAGIGAHFPKGCTLKATTVVFSNEVCSNFTAMSSRTLLSDHVCQTICRATLCVPWSAVCARFFSLQFWVFRPFKTEMSQGEFGFNFRMLALCKASLLFPFALPLWYGKIATLEMGYGASHMWSRVLEGVVTEGCVIEFLFPRVTEFHVLLTVHSCIIFFKWSHLGVHYFLVYLFQILYMFRATMCPSAGELTVSMRHIPTSRPDSHPYRVKNISVT